MRRGTENSSNNAWNLNLSNGNVNNNNKYNQNRVRPVCESVVRTVLNVTAHLSSISCYMVSYEDMFGAYYNCLHNKRKSDGAVKYFLGFEEDLIALADEINGRRYRPSVSSAFRRHRAEEEGGVRRMLQGQDSSPLRHHASGTALRGVVRGQDVQLPQREGCALRAEHAEGGHQGMLKGLHAGLLDHEARPERLLHVDRQAADGCCSSEVHTAELQGRGHRGHTVPDAHHRHALAGEELRATLHAVGVGCAATEQVALHQRGRSRDANRQPVIAALRQLSALVPRQVHGEAGTDAPRQVCGRFLRRAYGQALYAGVRGEDKNVPQGGASCHAASRQVLHTTLLKGCDVHGCGGEVREALSRKAHRAQLLVFHREAEQGELRMGTGEGYIEREQLSRHHAPHGIIWHKEERPPEHDDRRCVGQGVCERPFPERPQETELEKEAA